MDTQKIKEAMQQFGEKALEFILPNHYKCFGCGRSEGYYDCYLCEQCLGKLDFSHLSCRICGAKLSSNFSICETCRRENPIELFDKICPCAYYNDFAKDLLHRYKYLHERYLAKLFAKMIHDKVQFEHIDYDIIVPVVSGASRIRKRGFDHVEDICKELSVLSQKPSRKLLKRLHHDLSQVEKNRVQRQQEMEDAFVYVGDEPGELKVLLIDDLYTSGATMRSAGCLLKKHFSDLRAITVFHG